ncbi:DUF2512 family protein [Thalassobacillus sp. CUG 92003]|uniref:DUF2512 family protein n=1 Tax=Thalassobacillus sp. CUG 92003 TaxID=2736641 RepID=UPI0015E7CEB3|nr:DUF2512 family protein [Thalassobacillus sp. CUG 92003]
MKIVILPVLLVTAMYVLENVTYGAIWQPIVLAILLTGIGVAMEYMFLERGNLNSSVFLDFVTSLLIIWGASNFFTGAEVTFAGALILSLLITGCEYFIHRYLIASKKAEKSPA